MHSLNLRNRRHKSEGDELRGEQPSHPKFSRATWVAVAVGGSAVLGAGVSMYGANRQAQDNRAAQDQNAALQRDQNNASWTSWLLSKGIQPSSPVTAGTIPTAGNFTAANTRLPLWATMQRPTMNVPQPANGAGKGAFVTFAK